MTSDFINAHFLPFLHHQLKQKRKMGMKRSSSPKILILFFTVFAVSSALDMSIVSYARTTNADKTAQRSDEEVRSIYEEWLVKNGKVHTSLDQKEKRFQIFKDNLKFIDEHNAENRTYKVGLNRFADLSNDEYRSKYLKTKINPLRMMAKPSNRYAWRVDDNLPESVDWRKEGAVVRVKNQAECGKYCTLILYYYYILSFLLILCFSSTALYYIILYTLNNNLCILFSPMFFLRTVSY